MIASSILTEVDGFFRSRRTVHTIRPTPAGEFSFLLNVGVSAAKGYLPIPEGELTELLSVYRYLNAPTPACVCVRACWAELLVSSFAFP